MATDVKCSQGSTTALSKWPRSEGLRAARAHTEGTVGPYSLPFRPHPHMTAPWLRGKRAISEWEDGYRLLNFFK